MSDLVGQAVQNKRPSVVPGRHPLLACVIACSLGLFLSLGGCNAFGSSCSGGRRSGDSQNDQCTDANHYDECEGGEGYEYDVSKACPSEAPLCVASTDSTGHECVSQDEKDCVVELPDLYGTSVQAGDLNGDGSSDLVYLYGDTLTIALAAASGGYEAPVPLVQPVREFRIAQLTTDPSLDLVVLSNDGNVFILPGAGDGSFTNSGQVIAQGVAELLGTGDLDGDGRADIVLQNSVRRLKWASSAAQFAQVTVNVVAPDDLGQALVADTDGDGSAELIVSDSTPLTYVYQQQQDVWSLRQTLPGRAQLAADLNGDGAADLLQHQLGSVVVQLGRRDRGFDAEPAIVGDLLGASDLNSDGKLDLALSRGQQLFTLRGHGDGTFEEGAALNISTAGGTAFTPVVTGQGTDWVIGNYRLSELKGTCFSR